MKNTKIKETKNSIEKNKKYWNIINFYNIFLASNSDKKPLFSQNINEQPLEIILL